MGLRKVRILLSLALLGLLALVVAGCGSNGSPSASGWVVSVNSYRFAASAESSIVSGYYYYPDQGYQWLVVNLTLTNNRNTDASLNWFLDTFEYVSANGNRHALKLAFNDVENQLPTSYNPKQTKSGDIYFEVPLDENVATGKLVLTFWQQSPIIINMSGVPRL